ncbi:SDR family oxidoreductase [Corynebacterium uterequi]|uniref:Short-chain alcohol dehydrogenase n=1 Tax=Corynebacterium uterequi TaxID=1072256 RepID=A0A0G3HD09_9CORY|nr:SDR family oxidoreductase [Corynebacterium uterequi]AKK10600.1 short-chain alcohol dehydrogenase [Corynebacterium uterequi]
MKTILVTGASRGIGRAIAEELGRDYRILVGSTTPAGADEVVAQLPNAEAFVADLTDEHAVARAVADTGLDKEGSLDAVVHSAGVLERRPIEQLTMADWRASFAINVFAVAELTRLLLPALRSTRGTVVTINSGSGLHSGVGQAIYAGTKHALVAFTDALREEELGRIRVTSVHPGRVDTDMQRQLRRAEGFADADYDGAAWAKPASIARAVRLAVDMPQDATVPMVRVNPSGLGR